MKDPDDVGIMFLTRDAGLLASDTTRVLNGRGMAALLDKGARDTAWRLVREGRATAAAKQMLQNDVDNTLYPRVTIVAAVGKHGQLGLAGQIPWRVPGDMAHFRKLTAGGTVVVGRRTFESMGPLKGRRVVVISSKDDVEGADQVITDPLKIQIPAAGLFVCGGAGIYDAYLDVATRMVLSRVPYDGPADVYFPESRAKDLGWTMLTPPEKKDGFVVEEYRRIC